MCAGHPRPDRRTLRRGHRLHLSRHRGPLDRPRQRLLRTRHGSRAHQRPRPAAGDTQRERRLRPLPLRSAAQDVCRASEVSFTTLRPNLRNRRRPFLRPRTNTLPPSRPDAPSGQTTAEEPRSRQPATARWLSSLTTSDPVAVWSIPGGILELRRLSIHRATVPAPVATTATTSAFGSLPRWIRSPPRRQSP